jgi:hypothetical protein
MKEIHLLSKNERGLFFKTASDIKKMPLEGTGYENFAFAKP